MPQTAVSSRQAVQTGQPFSCLLTTSIDGASSRLALRGDLDIATAPVLRAALRAAHVRAQVVVLDLAGVEFMDSAGAHVIVDATEAATMRRRRLVTLHAPDRVRRVFGLTDTWRLLDLLDPATTGRSAIAED